MRRRVVLACLAAPALLLWAAGADAADFWGLKAGNLQLKSAGSLAFGPEGILFVGDQQAATVFAIDTSDNSGEPAQAKFNIDGLNKKIAETLGTSVQNIEINDLAANPLSGNLYLSVTDQQSKQPSIVQLKTTGEMARLPLKNVRFSKAELADAPEDKVSGEGRRRRNPRAESITDLAFIDGRVLISGLSSASDASTVRELQFPFAEVNPGTSIEIYHGAHGRYEANSPVRAFVPFMIGNEPNLLAGFTCTPLVTFPLSDLQPGTKVRGTTMAELGNRNRPLDMIVYEKGGKTYLLLSNSARGVMKISTDDIERDAGITERVGGGGTAGQKYETIADLKGVTQLAKLNDTQAVILVQDESGSQNLETIPLP